MIREPLKLLGDKLIHQNFEVKATTLVAVGILVGGVCSVIHIKFAQEYLADFEFARYLSWSAITLVFGSIFAGPIMTLGLSARSVGGKTQQKEIGEIEGLAIFYLTVQVLLFLILITNFLSVFDIEINWYSCGLIMSSIAHVISARQRAWLGGNSRWGLLASQIAIDGIFRILILLLIMPLSFIAFDAFVASALVAQFLSVLAISALNRFEDLTNFHFRIPSKQLLLGVVAIWSNSTGLQVIYASPSIAAYFGSVQPTKSSTAIGLVFMFARLPISFAPAFNVPYLVKDSAKRGTAEHREDTIEFLGELKFGAKKLVLTTASLFIVELLVLTIGFSFTIGLVAPLCLFSSVATGLFLYSQRITTWLIAKVRYSSVFLVWAGAIGLLVIMNFLIKSSVEFMSISVLIVAVFVSLASYFLTKI